MLTLQNIYSSDSIDDNFIINLFYNDKGHISNGKSQSKWLEKHINIYNYLLNRYSDSESLKETLYRIKKHIEIRPVCKTCGNHVEFVRSYGFNMYCCRHCATINENTQENRRKTCKEKYGVDHQTKCKSIQEKIQNTTFERYGYKSSFQDKDILNKAIKIRNDNWDEILKKKENTVLKHYGVTHQMKSEEVKEKIRNTCKSIDASSHWTSQLKKSKDTYRKNCVEKYGVDNYAKSNEFKNLYKNEEWVNKNMLKSYNTKKKNNSFNTSKIEERIYNKLINICPDTIRQYKSNKYPFNCDFYIPSLDLYIEYQGYYTHGTHPFNKNDEEDIKTLNNWKLKGYDTVVNIWSIRDPLKRKIAKDNNLNYIEMWDENIDFLHKFLK